jgi:hypothetical protein
VDKIKLAYNAIMEEMKQYTIDELKTAREELLRTPSSEITCALLQAWFVSNETKYGRAANQINLIPDTKIAILLNNYREEVPNQVVQAVRSQIIAITDEAIVALDNTHVVIPVLDTLILRVKDTKLAVLLNEFNRSKENNPNLAAIGLRTIITIIIQERAKISNPTSSLATKTDLGFEPDIKKALEKNIFDSAEAKLLKRYVDGGRKVTFDNVAHKPGVNTLVDKDDLIDSVNLLNKLLETILA